MILRVSDASALPAIARCHRAAFPGSLASALGPAFVARMLSWYLEGDKTFLIHLEDDSGRCVGYCGGMIVDGTLKTGSASGMAQHSFGAAVRAFALRPWLAFHPEVRAKWPVLARNVLMKLGLRSRTHHTPQAKAAFAAEPSAGLVVIGVDPASQGRGQGSRLLQEFERMAVETYGVRKLNLSVNASNARAIQAYQRNGWVQAGAAGSALRMEKRVPPAPA